MPGFGLGALVALVFRAAARCGCRRGLGLSFVCRRPVLSCLVVVGFCLGLVGLVVLGRSALRLACAARLRARLGAAGFLVSVWFLLAGPLRAWRGPCACGVRLGWRRAGSGLVVLSSSLGCRLVLFCRPLRGCRRCCCALLPCLPRFFRSCLPAAAALPSLLAAAAAFPLASLPPVLAPLVYS